MPPPQDQPTPPNPDPLPFIKPPIASLRPLISPPANNMEPPAIQTLLTRLHMRPHTEGGYFSEAYRDSRLVPSSYPATPASASQWDAATPEQKREEKGFEPSVRNVSTTMFYLLTPGSPVGFFHRNRGATVHTLHRGRGRYVVIHPVGSHTRSHSHPASHSHSNPDHPGPGPDPGFGSGPGSESGSGLKEGGGGGGEGGGDRRVNIESFVVGLDRQRGEKQRWLVEGGKYKATFLLPDLNDNGEEGGTSGEGMLVSETVMPGFEFFDHEFLEREKLEQLVGREWAGELGWLVEGEE